MSEVNFLKVYTLGEFAITAVAPDGSETRLTDGLGRSKKLWMLIEYLALHREREVSQDELIDLLWSEGDLENPLGSLKLIVHRSRNELSSFGSVSGKQIIVNRRGAYAWGDRFKTLVDADEFDELCRRAGSGAPEQRIESMLRAIEIYRGDFLPKSASEPWVMPLSTYYHTKYINLCLDAVTLLREAGRYNEVIDICQRAVDIDPYVETLHLSLIRAMAASGSPKAALDRYNRTTKLFLTQFGVTPSDEFTSIYKELVRTTNSAESDLSVVRARLAEGAPPPGAFYCEYECFKEIYRQRAREGSRTGQSVHLAMITMVPGKNKELNQKQINHLIERLDGTIQTSLRNGDVYTRFSVMQFLMMLPATSFENVEMILERINRNFRCSYPKSGVLLQTTVLPLEPIMN